MGKSDGYLEWQRVLPGKRDKRARVRDWKEFQLAQTPDVSRQQGGRCMDCGIPFCHQGCPLGNLIPEWNDLVYRDRWQEAYRRLDATNNFPEFTGRLCPAPCEAACVLNINDDPVTIEQMEKEIIERAFAEGWVKAHTPAPRTGKRVAVVGSGPAGLAAAQQLNLAGHEVVVLERADRLGGLLRYGIPDFKMQKGVIDRRLALMREEGVSFQTGADVGVEPTWDALAAEYDAVLVAVGAGRPRDLDVPGRELDGVVMAMDYLEQQNRVVAGETPPGPRIDARGRNVIILGGGDTGSDCLGTALRQGAASVAQVELMPRPPAERADENPWPQWPLVFRTSSSQAEGGDREFAVLTKRLEGKDGKLTRLHAVEVRFVRDGGRLRLEEVPGTERSYDVDLLILAMGFVSPVSEALVEQLGVDLDARGNVAVDKAFRTSVEGVYAAGDASRGASLIVWAISDGREAARTIDADLARRPSLLPSRGIDQAWP
ncbi:MAG: glutamate synthase subunit beta [Deltaproteobacteria bacterium]|nr:glutamate synthase subunit beta [Deltaproteobacteria bacterium]MCB9788736.1 glutamate synthase subunit beta [Deltaproteobacteria bacterium]